MPGILAALILPRRAIMFSTFAIVITLLLLMFFAYRGYSVLILAPIMAILAVFLSGDFLSSIPAYTDIFMGALSGFLLKFFPIFLLGALFGRLMADSRSNSDCQNRGRKTRCQQSHFSRYLSLRYFNLWRRLFICRGICYLSNCQRLIQSGRYS